MVRTYIPRAISREERGRRKMAADLALLAAARIEVQGLVKSWDYRFWPGTTLDRALQPGHFWDGDLAGLSFPEWLAQKDPGFDLVQHTIGYWADQQTQEHVLTMLQNYASEMQQRSLPVP